MNTNLFRLLILFLLPSCFQKEERAAFDPNDFSSSLMLGYLSAEKQPSPHIGNTYIFRKNNKVVHYEVTGIYSAYLQCCYKKIELSLSPTHKTQGYLSTEEANDYRQQITAAYQDSQRIHKDSFLQDCEDTKAINQAFINANIKTADYKMAEIAEILKRWDFAVYSLKLDKTKPINSINAGDTSKMPLLGGNKFVQSHFDTRFYPKEIQDENILIGVFNKEPSERIQTFLYTVYEQDGFVQVKKRIIDGEKMFIGYFFGLPRL